MYSGSTVHNPDRFMMDLRQILSQGRKRIGLMVGAGAALSVRVNKSGNLDPDGTPLIPAVAGLTSKVMDSLERHERSVIDTLLGELGLNANIEEILTRVRRLSEAIGSAKVHGMNGTEFHGLAERICEAIGKIVGPALPAQPNAFTELVSWIGGTQRQHSVEIFTTNYDLLLEEAFERVKLPYFDGFTGAHRPFFDPVSIGEDQLPPRWSRLWKIHGSLGWDVGVDTIVRTGSREATKLIYPEHLKYDQITRQPYSALFERFRYFLTTPDSLLISTGFSFFDAHITSVIDEALAANRHTAVIGFQYGPLSENSPAYRLALRRPNMSLYANDGAVIFGVPGRWQPGQPPNDEWLMIRSSFWDGAGGDGKGAFTLGDFAQLARFCALTQAREFSGPGPISAEPLVAESSAQATKIPQVAQKAGDA